MMNQPLPTQPMPMTKAQLDFWKGEVKCGLKRQKKEFRDRIKYDELIDYLEGQQGKDSWTIIDEMSPALLSVVSNVYYQNPTVVVEAGSRTADAPVQPSMLFMLQNPDFRPYQLTELMQGALHYAMRKTAMKWEMQVSAFDLMLAGFAVVEVNHEVVGQEQPFEDARQEERQNPLLDSIASGIKNIYGKMTGSNTKEEAEEEASKDAPQNTKTDQSFQTYVKRWNPGDVIFDSKAKTFDESRFVTKIVRMSLAEFNVKYPKFKGRVTASSDDLPGLEYAEFDAEDHKKAVTLYEVEIKKSQGPNCVLVMYMGIDEPIDYYTRPITTNNFALKYACLDKYGKLYPISRAKKAKKNQDDVNHYMTIQFEHVDRAMRKIAYFNEGLTESGKTAQMSNDPYALVEKKIPGSVYEVMPAPPVVPENKELVARSVDTINKLIGTNELMKSGESQNDTLGQDQIQVTAFQGNVNALQDALADLSNEVLDGLKDIIQQLWDGDDYFKVTGIKGGDAWYDPAMGPLADILLGDYLVNSNIASAQRPNPDKDREMFVAYANMITSPDKVMFAQMHGKRPSMEILNALAKKFEQNPEMIYEDIPAPPPALPTDPQNANMVNAQESRFQSEGGPAPMSPEMGMADANI
jgi:hypothetical protein